MISVFSSCMYIGSPFLCSVSQQGLLMITNVYRTLKMGYCSKCFYSWIISLSPHNNPVRYRVSHLQMRTQMLRGVSGFPKSHFCQVHRPGLNPVIWIQSWYLKRYVRLINCNFTRFSINLLNTYNVCQGLQPELWGTHNMQDVWIWSSLSKTEIILESSATSMTAWGLLPTCSPAELEKIF